jgi:hypothetical protein
MLVSGIRKRYIVSILKGWHHAADVQMTFLCEQINSRMQTKTNGCCNTLGILQSVNKPVDKLDLEVSCSVYPIMK